MGFWDKVKLFFGGHGVTAEFTEIEGQSVRGDVYFPVTDTVLKGHVRITGTKEVTILSHDYEVYLEENDEDGESVLVAEDSHDASTDIIGGDLTWPYTLKPGDVIEDSFCITDVDLEEACAQLGIDDPYYVVDHSYYRFYVKFTADVKGTALDADDEFEIDLTD
jgi:hypothetical protein